MCKYRIMKEKHQAEVNAFPMFFAFSTEQFNKGMSKLGLDPGDTDKIYRIGSTGGFYRKTDHAAFNEMLDRHAHELADEIAADKTGDGFIFDMFDYELANHEYNYTLDTEATLDALGITRNDFSNNPALRIGLHKACDAADATNYK